MFLKDGRKQNELNELEKQATHLEQTKPEKSEEGIGTTEAASWKGALVDEVTKPEDFPLETAIIEDPAITLKM